MAKVDIIKLQDKRQNTQSIYAIQMMVDRARERGHDVYFPPDVFGSAMVTRARNISLRKIRQDSDFVLFVDDDMIPVASALVRLVSRNVPVVSALCTTRTFPPAIAAKHYDKETGEFSGLENFDEDRLIKGPWAIGFGFVLIQTPVLRRIEEYVLSGYDWLDFNRKQLDRLHVRAENREMERKRIEEKRRKRFEQEKYIPVFQMPIDDQLQSEIAEDMHFSRMLHQLDIPVYIDTDCIVGHIGDFPYSPAHCGVKSHLSVDFGEAA